MSPGLIKEMSDNVQFLVITHNKITMEMADYLMGVTMQEAGVSRLVSVDVEANRIGDSIILVYLQWAESTSVV